MNTLALVDKLEKWFGGIVPFDFFRIDASGFGCTQVDFLKIEVEQRSK